MTPIDAQPDAPAILSKDVNDEAISCMIPANAKITVHYFSVRKIAPLTNEAASEARGIVTDEISGRFKLEAKNVSLLVSEFRGYPTGDNDECLKWIREVLLGQDLGDGVCAAKLARRTGVDWVLIGAFDAISGHYDVRAQLVSSDDPASRRELRFGFTGRHELPDAIHKAWRDLVRPNP